MRIAQISDLHYTHITWNPFRLCSKRILGNINWLLTRRSVFQPELLDPLPSLFSELQVDLVLLGGDFTTSALKEEYEKAHQFIEKIKQNWIAIPGNHDHYTYRSHRNKHFYRYFSNREGSYFRLKDHGVEVHALAPGWWLITLDTARATGPRSSQGLFTEQQEEYLVEALGLLPPGDSVICFNHYPFFPQEDPRRNLARGEALQSLLQRSPQIRLYLHGHTHRHSMADLQPNHLPILLDSGCCVQGKEATWNLIDLLPDHCITTAYRWNDGWKTFRTEKMTWMKSS